MRRERIIYAVVGVALVAALMTFSFWSDSGTPTRSNANIEAGRRKQPSPSDRMPPRTFRHNLKVEEEYDKFLGINGIAARQMQVAGTFPEGIQMSATYLFKSDKERGSFVLTFIVSGKYANLMEHSNPVVRSLLAVTDEQRIDLGVLETVNSIDKGGGPVHLLTTTSIPKQTFLQLVGAEEVEMRLGNHELTLTEEYLEAMRDVASRATN